MTSKKLNEETNKVWLSLTKISDVELLLLRDLVDREYNWRKSWARRPMDDQSLTVENLAEVGGSHGGTDTASE